MATLDLPRTSPDHSVSAASSAEGPLRAGAQTAALRMLVLAVGPVATVLVLLGAAQRAEFPDIFAHVAAWVALVMWSPLPASLPAILLDADRDAALPQMARPVRAFALIPYMLWRSPARVEVGLSLVGWAAAIWVAVAFAAL